MAVMSADLFRLAAIELDVAGAIPATPAWTQARITGESINFTPNTTTSNELDASGQVRDSILTGATVSGNVEMEVSYNPFFEVCLAAVFRNDWGTGSEGDGADPPVVTTVSANELIPAKTLGQFAIEKTFFGPVGSGIVDQYQTFKPVAFDSLAISIAPNAPITASLAVIGGLLELADTGVTGATYLDPGQSPVMTAPLVVTIIIGAVPMTLCFNSLNLTFNSNDRGIECIGTLGIKEQTLGRFEATIEGAAYFIDNDMLQALIDQDEFPVEVELTDSLANSYNFKYPRCKMTAGSVNAAGTGQDVIANVSIQALYDSTRLYTCIVTRTHTVPLLAGALAPDLAGAPAAAPVPAEALVEEPA